jgi:hypothetical protein
MEKVDVADKDTKLTDVVVDLPLVVDNPVFVYDSQGKPLGSAVLSFVHGGMQARLFLDAHNPVSFDLANEPERCVFKLHARIVDGTVDKATLSLDSK